MLFVAQDEVTNQMFADLQRSVMNLACIGSRGDRHNGAFRIENVCCMELLRETRIQRPLLYRQFAV